MVIWNNLDWADEVRATHFLSAVSHATHWFSLSVAGANLMGSDLYNNLIKYFAEHLKGLLHVGFTVVVARPMLTRLATDI